MADTAVKLPALGSRFRRMGYDPLTGSPKGFRAYTVAELEAPRFLSPAGRIRLDGDSGATVYADADTFWKSGYQVIDNVRVFPGRALLDALKEEGEDRG